MATKAPLYENVIRDGNGCHQNIVAAPSEADVKNMNSTYLSPHEKEEKISRLGWAVFNARPTEDDDGVEFVGELNGNVYIFGPNHLSHPFLVRQFPHQTAEVEEHLRRLRDCEP
jgi:hypothetical protein